MPQLGPAFLHRPIGAADFASLTKGLLWLRDGFLAALPRTICEIGWKPEATRYEYTADNELMRTGLIEASWAGAMRVSDTNESECIAAEIVLAPQFVFKTSVNLPEAAASTLEKTIALRIEDICPIPVDEAGWSVGEVTRLEDNRIEVPVAIIRKETLRKARRAAEGRQVKCIGASSDDTGRMTFIFEKADNRNAGLRRWLIGAFALWISCLLLINAWDGRQVKMLAAKEAYQADLREALRTARRQAELVARIETYAPRALTLTDAYQALSTQSAFLPPDSVITAALIEGDRVIVSGFTPHGLSASAMPKGFSLSPSDYEGFTQFSFAAPLTSIDQHASGP